jgi:hypothetical protein
MIDFGNRRIFDDGTVVLSPDAAMEVIYAGGSLDGAWLEPCDDVTMHNDSNRMLDTDLSQLRATDGPRYGNTSWFDRWTTPEPYASMDVLSHCLDRCANQAERDRVAIEHGMFDERGMIPVLRHLMFAVDELRSKGITWGVGRGSSVSSLMLYLIGINRINPMDHDLDINEFLK